MQLLVVGSGWWEDSLRKYAAEAGAGDLVRFEGQVSEDRKHDILAKSWLMLLPSLKEGWGLVVGEAGAHRVPTIAYSTAGGTCESVEHEHSGLLVDDPEAFTRAVHELISDGVRRRRLGDGAFEMSRSFAWEHSQASFGSVLNEVLAGRRVSVVDPEGP